ncbi:MAG TPA: RtcB family protein [Anaerolineaceae bacterium]|nr:RtcB family protein [Anaerolineaceae bacterium]
MSLSLSAFTQHGDYLWELPAGTRPDQRVAVRFVASRPMLQAALADLAVEQALNAAALPGLAGPVMIMPDVHQGYGFPIGGVAAMRYPEGLISPGAIGYDINCGVRLLASSVNLAAAEPVLGKLAAALDNACPSGVGVKGGRRLTEAELAAVCRQGAAWAVKQGLGSSADLRRAEDGGTLEGADPTQLSERARERGREQLGTVGSGNHFVEVGVVTEILDEGAARVLGLFPDCLTLMIHCGSRGLGHQVCTDFVHDFQSAAGRGGYLPRDRELVSARLDSAAGQAYLGAMRAAANFAYCNRQILAQQARQAFEQILAGRVRHVELQPVYDVTHNMGKIETHFIADEKVRVCVHRKGATRAFGPGAPDLPEDYRQLGQPVLVPGSMGTESWVLVGQAESMALTYGSCCHGAGRVMSRSEAKRSVNGARLQQELAGRGIQLRAGSLSGLAEEAPAAYKDVGQVVETVIGAGLARPVARLRPVAVIKG